MLKTTQEHNKEIPKKRSSKALGAWFNGDIKKWYVRPGMDIEPFKKWIPRTSGRCGVYVLLQIYLLGALLNSNLRLSA